MKREVRSFSIEQVGEFLQQGFPKDWNQQGSLRYMSSGGGAGDISPVRTPMVVPESAILMVSPAACARHGSIGNILNGNGKRMWTLRLEETEIVSGEYLKRVEEAAWEVIRKSVPPIKALFICGFTRMEPILNKHWISGESRTLKSIYGMIRCSSSDKKERAINIIGREKIPAKESDFYRILQYVGIDRVNHMSLCKTMEDIDRMGNAVLNIGIEPRTEEACKYMEKNLGIPYVRLNNTYDLDEIKEGYMKISEALGRKLDDSLFHRNAKEKIDKLVEKWGNKSIVVGEKLDRRPFKAAKDLVKWGLSVNAVFSRFIVKEDMETIFKMFLNGRRKENERTISYSSGI
ncbi:nitrogenase component 1 [Tissierella praeacuta]|uniref:nitrogenase component 1 n=1 Tax=Tissierella praeacuta TaxID=43131 RepID=UPI00333FB6CE